VTGTTRQYRQQRARAMAYGTWQPWADPAPVREHVRQLRECGASYDTIGHAAGVAPMSVHALMNGRVGRVRAVSAEALLGLTAERLDLVRVPVAATQLRIRALVAMGHSYSRIARALGGHFDTVHRIARGGIATAPASLQTDVSRLYRAWWDKTPPERTKGERIAAEAARRRAERSGWPPGAALDDSRIGDPGYSPRAPWRHAEGTGIAPHDPLGRERQHRIAEAAAAAGPRQEPEQELEAAG
jgi:hypothetical protein